MKRRNLDDIFYGYTHETKPPSRLEIIGATLAVAFWVFLSLCYILGA